MIIRRETKVDVPARYGMITILPETDQQSSTWAAQRNTVAIQQRGETIRVLETEARGLAEALTAAADLFKEERESACRATMRRIAEEGSGDPNPVDETNTRVVTELNVTAQRELGDALGIAFRNDPRYR